MEAAITAIEGKIALKAEIRERKVGLIVILTLPVNSLQLLKS